VFKLSDFVGKLIEIGKEVAEKEIEIEELQGIPTNSTLEIISKMKEREATLKADLEKTKKALNAEKENTTNGRLNVKYI